VKNGIGMRNYSDETLIERAKQQDDQAVGILYQEHHTDVFRYLYYLTGDRPTAEDLTSEVFIRMMKALPNYRQNGRPFKAWLIQIAKNLSTDHFRRESRWSENSLVENLPGTHDIMDERATKSLNDQALQVALEALQGTQREVIIMRFILDMPLQEVASTMGKSEDAVKGLQRRGLLSLRKILADMEVYYD
jgi:RNA polymerase sigma-70 factor (ECF subfamily)